ncbi:low molecular weight phosphatase family protein [Georgenia sp. SUBG003]|uniref:arsenate reductase/protein-tyrosine-phosphatase family protein n=1 Tax=Georgenia sp. SUBG003 TaxID=1497974 RepID=UPI0004D6E777|nr:arsenate reductase [Georgenia sp. SUBG003]
MTVRGMPGLSDPDHELRGVVADLTRRYDGTLAPETVERTVMESYTALARTAKVTTHLPVLAAHFATERLAALARAKGVHARDCPEVLFVCVQNAGRSQMAALLLEHYSAGRVRARSAGAAPIRQVDPHAVAAMAERGLDMSHAYPKPLTDDVVRAADVVVTMGSADAVPVYPDKRYEEWGLADPAEDTIEEARRIRDDVDARVLKLLEELAPLGS